MLFLGPAFFPHRNPPAGGVLKEKEDSWALRRTGDGGGPHFSWDHIPLGVNEHIDMTVKSRFPDLTCPTPRMVAQNLAIIASLAATTGITKLRCCLLLTDWTKYYRSMKVRAIWLWTSCLCISPLGLLVDLVKWFGDRGAPATCCPVMDVLLFFWTTVALLLLERVTVYCVRTKQARPAGTVQLALDSHKSTAVREVALTIVDSVTLDKESQDWDADPKVHEWRQRRYNCARAAGADDDSLSPTSS